ncbi:Protein N-terminal glutamine amidohydrolase [Frankliniella fusca]|uniref:Protein N-terminal glutamine amidohydrolase n=1 Tax=Frankliniella fusca TaxID=407009 RepID=A0AAE1HHD5_9NEOP|nr:Protein N-terminal glutamine amidohydrolase [Frankliniella fusca]
MAEKKIEQKSPYKKVLDKNATHCGFLSMRQLEPNKPYQMTNLVHTTKYGSGELAYLKTSKNTCWKVQLPTKYLKTLNPEDIDTFKADIERRAFPYLIFREVMPDNSFHMDIVEDSPEMRDTFKKWEDVPPIIPSLNNSNASCDSPPTKKGKKDDEEGNNAIATTSKDTTSNSESCEGSNGDLK